MSTVRSKIQKLTAATLVATLALAVCLCLIWFGLLHNNSSEAASKVDGKRNTESSILRVDTKRVSGRSVASKKTSATSMLEKLAGMPGLELGAGRINGRNTPIAVVKGMTSVDHIWQSLLKQCENKCTPTIEEGPLGPVAVLLDIRSPHCPACQIPNAESISRILSESIVVSFIGLGNADSENKKGNDILAIGSLAGVISDQINSISDSLTYEGALFEKLDAMGTLQQQSSFVFGNSSIHSTNFVTTDISDTINELSQALKKRGFKPFTPDDRLPEIAVDLDLRSESSFSKKKLLTDIAGNWAKGQDLIQFQITQNVDPTTQINFVKVHINEISL